MLIYSLYEQFPCHDRDRVICGQRLHHASGGKWAGAAIFHGLLPAFYLVNNGGRRSAARFREISSAILDDVIGSIIERELERKQRKHVSSFNQHCALQCSASYYTILYCAMLCHAVLSYAMVDILYCIVLCCAVLCCAVILCTVLCCAVLWYAKLLLINILAFLNRWSFMTPLNHKTINIFIHIVIIPQPVF